MLICRLVAGFCLRVSRVEDKARIGRMVKRIFDYGRVLYLRSLGLQAEMVHYCDAAVSPENCLIIAWK